MLNGYDEAIVLTMDGHVSEGSAENLFMVRNGKLITPPITDDILEGVTRTGLIQLAREDMGMETVIRSIDRSELYVADEAFLCGTGAQMSPIVEIDHRPVGNGEVGPITRQLAQLYFDTVRGKLPAAQQLAHADLLIGATPDALPSASGVRVTRPPLARRRRPRA